MITGALDVDESAYNLTTLIPWGQRSCETVSLSSDRLILLSTTYSITIGHTHKQTKLHAGLYLTGS